MKITFSGDVSASFRLWTARDSQWTSCTIHGGTIRITEFRFPDDRIIRIEVHRNVAGEDGAWLEPISPVQSFFETMPVKQPPGEAP